MAFWMVGLVALVAIVALAMYLLRDESLNRERVEAELHDPGTPKLEYVVPTGEDPTIVLAALERAGYTAGVDSRGAHQVVLVACPDGLDRHRAQVRSIIAGADVTTLEDGGPVDVDVRFRDET
jgi:hypothetical protein